MASSRTSIATAMEAARHSTISEMSKLKRHKNTRITTIYLDLVDDSTAYRLIETVGKVLQCGRPVQ